MASIARPKPGAPAPAPAPSTGGAGELLGLIPPGTQYDMLRFSISTVASIFPGELKEITAARVSGWVNDINAGVRDDDQIRSDIFQYVVEPSVIKETLGVTDDQVSRLISGALTFSALGAKAAAGGPGVETVGSSVIPTGGTLVKVNNPAGSDAGSLYWMVYEWKGVEFAFEIGDAKRFEELFGSEAAFDTKTTVRQNQFDSKEYVLSGSIDQHLGADESFTALMERETRATGLEDLPAWVDKSPEVLSIMAQGAAQGWSASRIWEQISKTEAFGDRFGSTIKQYTQGGGTIQNAVQQILADETALSTAVRRFQNVGTKVDEGYLQRALSNGWTAAMAGQVLEATNQLVRSPMALSQANDILTRSGLQTLDRRGFINVLLGDAPDDVTEALNTAFAAQALTEAGIADVDLKLLMQVVDTTDRVLTPEAFRETAQQLAFNFARFSTELDRDAFGIGEDEVTAALFGRESPSGRSSGDVLNTLARFERDRRAAAQGFGGAQAFIDDQSRLRFQGV